MKDSSWVKLLTAGAILVFGGSLINGWWSLPEENQVVREDCTEQLGLYELCIWEIVRREGVKLEAYECPAGLKTIGIGTRTDTLDQITLGEARQLLRSDFQRRYDVIAAMLPNHERHEHLAVAMLAHNIGMSRLVSSPQWIRIKDKTEDCVRIWLEYSYYTAPNGKRIKSTNLEQARQFEVAMFTMDKDRLVSLRDTLQHIALKSYIAAK